MGGHEEEKCEQDCQGQICQVRRLSWIQGEDHKWPDQERFGGEQAWQDCEQEKRGSWQEAIRQHQGLDNRSPEGKEGTWCEGLHRCQEGHCSLQEGQGALPVNRVYIHMPRLQLRVWGCLHPSSAIA